MRAGLLRHRVTIQSPGSDGMWTDVATVWAEMLDSAVSAPGDDLALQATTLFRLRYRTGILPGMRIVTDASTYEVTAPPVDLDGRRRTMEITGRAYTSAGFVDQCIVTRSDPSTFDPVTGLVTTPAPSIVYAGGCRIVQTGMSEAMAGTIETPRRTITVDIDRSAPILRGDMVRITASADTSLAARRFVIDAIEIPTAGTTRRLNAEEVTA